FSQRRLVLGFEQRLPSIPVQSEECIVIDPMALDTVLTYDLPYWTVRPIHFRPCWSSILRRYRSDQARGQCNREYRLHLKPLHQVRPGSRPVLSPRLSRWMSYRSRRLKSMFEHRCTLSGNTMWRFPLKVPSTLPMSSMGTFSCACRCELPM